MRSQKNRCRTITFGEIGLDFSMLMRGSKLDGALCTKGDSRIFVDTKIGAVPVFHQERMERYANGQATFGLAGEQTRASS
jgi:hypothetical protein